MRLIDVVNFNGDASCFASEAWFSVLEGGVHSRLCKWLELYVEFVKPVSIGFTGATLADIGAFNPEAITILRNHPEVFQILWRPFAHDLPFFRTDQGFELNLSLGRKAAEHLIGRVTPIYLPPEFMQTNRQTKLLLEHGLLATFVMESRLKSGSGSNLPKAPFWLKGIPDGRMICIPISGDLTQAYLSTIQMLDTLIWQKAIDRFIDVVMWRDGESSFLIPDGIDRERFWLENSPQEREHLDLSRISGRCPANDLQQFGYPIHPFSAWLNEMRMLWFLQRVRELEQRIVSSASPEAIARWLNCINSDILSAVEKPSPLVSLRSLGENRFSMFQIDRSQRGFEGEALLERAEKNQENAGDEFWQKKALAREKLVCELF